MIKKLDIYIMKRFIQTFLFVALIFILIAIVVDVTEKLEDFIEHNAPLSEIFTVYYVNFIPHIAALLAPLFVFLAVILFTSKLANDSEIVAVLGNGINFYRLLRPFFLAALLLTAVMVYVNNWLVPHANKVRIDFEETYVVNRPNHFLEINLTAEKLPDKETHISLSRYNSAVQEGYQMTIQTIENDKLVKQIRAPRVIWKPETKQWQLTNYDVWEINGMEESVYRGEKMDTFLNFTPLDFTMRLQRKEALDYEQLNEFIAEEKRKGSEKIPHYLIEKYSRNSNAFAIIVLTFIGVAVSSRKKRGGIGINMAIGFLISAVFILFLRFSTTFATNANLPAIIAVWIPNFVFGIIALVMIRIAPK